MLSRKVLVPIVTILLWATTIQTMPFQCPDTLPGVISTQPQLPLTKIRVIEGESFTFTCARACGSEAQWLMRIPKSNQAIYFPERRASSSQLPQHMTATLQDNAKCDQCPIQNKFPLQAGVYQITFYTLQLNNIHKDINESKIYCGQRISSGTSFVEEPITLIVYSPDTQFDKQFPLPRRAFLKPKLKVAKRITGNKFIDRSLHKLRKGDTTAQIVMFFVGAVFILSLVLMITLRILSSQADPEGVTFIGRVYTTTISYYEKTVHWPEAGIKLHIPRGVLPVREKSIFSCRQAIAGPFIVPPGQTLATTIYHVTVTPPLQGEIELTVPHAAKLRTTDDCASMQFLRASDYPVVNDQGNIEYHFKEVNYRPCTFTARSKQAKIRLREFSFWCCSTSKPKTLDYLVKIASPREPLLPRPHAIYAVSLATPTLDKFFDDLLERQYPGEHIKSTDGRQIVFKSDSDYAELHLPTENIREQKYRVKVKSGTEKITKKMADLPARNEEYKQHYSPMYPPRAELEFSVIDDQNPPPKPLECDFNITVNTERSIDGIKFPVSLPQVPPPQPLAGVAANGTLATIHSCPAANLFEMIPTPKNLQLIKWQDGLGQPKELNIIERGSDMWMKIGDLFEIDKSVLREYEDGFRYNSARFRHVLLKWIEKGGTPTYQCTWNGLIDVLQDVQHSTLANDIKQALNSMEKATTLYKKTV